MHRVLLLWLRERAACMAVPLELHPSTLYPRCAPACWQDRGTAWDSPGGQSCLFTPYHKSSEITSALSTPVASCLVNPYLYQAGVAAARRQGADRQNGQGYPAGSGAL